MNFNFHQYRGPTTSDDCVFCTILLDESVSDMLENLDNATEDDMFNPLTIGREQFTVEFDKADGSPGKITGYLVAPNYEGTDNELMAYSLGLLEKDVIPVYTEKGWRSFYKDKVTFFKFGG